MARVPLLHVSGPEVIAAMPSVAQRLVLAERALRALAGSAQLPAKIGVQPRPPASWAHAMPAWVPGDADDGSLDLLGMKFVSGFPANARLGLPALHATLLLCDPTTGRPRAVMDAGSITAARTAAVSGVVIQAWGHLKPASVIGLVGAGVQAEGHVEVLASVAPRSHLRIHDRDPLRASALARRALDTGSFASATTSDSAAVAIRGADVTLTMVSFGPDRQALPADAYRETGLVIAVDYDMCLPSTVARTADSFLVDEVGQFLANRSTGIFAGYPDPTGPIGGRLDEPWPSGQVVVVHLGTGVADLVFGAAILATVQAQGSGTPLPD